MWSQWIGLLGKGRRPAKFVKFVKFVNIVKFAGYVHVWDVFPAGELRLQLT